MDEDICIPKKKNTQTDNRGSRPCVCEDSFILFENVLSNNFVFDTLDWVTLLSDMTWGPLNLGLVGFSTNRLPKMKSSFSICVVCDVYI